jgi:hypothetical protein
MLKREYRVIAEQLKEHPVCRVCLTVSDTIAAATTVVEVDGELHSVCDAHGGDGRH